jgi:hypothetical protein
MRLVVAVAVCTWASARHAAAEAVEVVTPFEPLARAEIAEVNRFGVGSLGDGVRIDRITATLRDHDSGTIADVVIVVGVVGSGRDLSIPLVVSRGARVTAAAMTLGKRPRDVASVTEAPTARSLYEQAGTSARSTILVTWTRVAAGSDELELRVSPVAANEPATIELAIELPPAKALEIDPGGTTIRNVAVVAAKRAAWTRVKAPKRAALAPRGAAMFHTVSRPFVSPVTALYGAEAPTTTEIVIPSPSVATDCFGDNGIRTTIRTHLGQLRRCYTKVVEYTGGLEGEAILHFTILPSGRTSEISVGGNLGDRITRCLADEVARWQFRVRDGVAEIHYPLRFRLAEER